MSTSHSMSRAASRCNLAALGVPGPVWAVTAIVREPNRWGRGSGAVRRTSAWVLTAAAALLAVGSGGLFALRFLPADALPVRPDTVAMAAAFTDFAAPGFFASTVLAGTALLLRQRRPQAALAVLCAVATVVQVAALAPRWVAAPVPATSGSFTVLALNSRLGYADPAEVARTAAAADVVVLTEVTRPQARALEVTGFSQQFPHRSEGRLPAAGAAGTAVFSRFPITRTERLAPDLNHQNWVCTVTVPGVGPVQVVAVHPARPYRGGSRWLPEQRILQDTLPTSGLRVLVGDFNAVASHPTQRALRDAGWRTAVDQTGAGWAPTYPADSGRLPALIDIDHAYVSDGLQATALRRVEVSGTDHLGLLVTVGVKPA